MVHSKTLGKQFSTKAILSLICCWKFAVCWVWTIHNMLLVCGITKLFIDQLFLSVVCGTEQILCSKILIWLHKADVHTIQSIRQDLVHDEISVNIGAKHILFIHIWKSNLYFQLMWFWQLFIFEWCTFILIFCCIPTC